MPDPENYSGTAIYSIFIRYSSLAPANLTLEDVKMVLNLLYISGFKVKEVRSKGKVQCKLQDKTIGCKYD